jgi:hypothetical protein
VERFAHNSLVELPTASKAKLERREYVSFGMNLVGSISFYDLSFTFTGEHRLNLLAKERTGLNQEEITGVSH